MNKQVLQTLIIYSVTFILCLLSATSIVFAETSANFALSEHWAMGQQIKLRFTTLQSPIVAAPLNLQNGLTLTFGDIISLGDLYGIVGRPISHAANQLERQARFKEVFKTFAKSTPAITEVMELNTVIKKEMTEIEAAREQGETAEAFARRIGVETARQVNCITGGGCTNYGWWLSPGRYLLLALENYDHFAQNNLAVYESGHQVALTQALKAHTTGNRADLELAYAMDAFACHFLSDHFAAGHLRTPREELKNLITPAVLGSLLSIYMHNEESMHGIHVHNDLGEQWVTYGDFAYYNPLNQTNQQILLRSLQQSVDEIFDAYYTGQVPEKSLVTSMTPQVDKIPDENNMDIAPMFYWDEQDKKLLRRTDLSNPYDRHWTKNWWGWSTLVLLKAQYGITSTVQISLTRYLSSHSPQEWANAAVG